MEVFLIIFSSIFIFSNAQSTQNIIVLYVNEDANEVAESSVDVALAYIKKNNKLGINAEVTRVSGNRTYSTGLLEALCKVYNGMLEKSEIPHFVLDTTMTDLASETVKSFTQALALPTISASFGQVGDLRQWRTIDKDEEKYLIQISPPADMIPEIIRKLVLHQNVSNTAILFDPTFVMDHKYKSLLQNIATRHLISAIEPARLTAQIQRLRSLDLVTFFVLGTLESIKAVLDVADKLNYMDRKFAWYAITQDLGEIKCNIRNGSVIFIKPLVNANFQNRLGQIRTSYQLTAKPEIAAAFYFDFTLHSLITVKGMMDDGSWKKTNTTNFITCDEYDGKNTPKRVGLDLRASLKHELDGSTEVPTFGPIEMIANGLSQMDFDMSLSLVSFRDGAADKTVPIGTWKAGLNNSVNFVEDRIIDNFTAALIYRVVIAEQIPFIFRDETHPKGYNGYCIDLMDKIGEVLRFEYEVILATGNVFGNMDEKGKWGGLIKDLMDKKADIGLGPISVMAERESVIDFTVPYYDLVGITILMKLPTVSTSLFKFLSVLEDEVWLCILAAYFFTSFLMWVFDRYSPYSYQNNREKYKDDEEKREFNLKECLWFCMTSLTPQGGGEAPKNLSGRLMAATWWLFGFIIIASYTANLAAFLTVSRLETPIESLDDLSKQYKIQYAPKNGSSTATYFRRMADIEARFYEIWKDMSLNDSLSDIERAKLAVWDYPVSDKYTKMWQAMKEAGFPKTLEEAVARIRLSKGSTEGFAYIGDATDIKYLEMTNCDLKPIGEEFSRKPYALAVQQGSPLKDQLNTAILQLLNRRELERLKEKWWTKNPKRMKCEIQENQSDGISIQNIGGVFIVIFVGIGLACITLAFEYYWYKYRKVSKVVSVQEVPPLNQNTFESNTFKKAKFGMNKFEKKAAMSREMFGGKQGMDPKHFGGYQN